MALVRLCTGACLSYNSMLDACLIVPCIYKYNSNLQFKQILFCNSDLYNVLFNFMMAPNLFRPMELLITAAYNKARRVH